MKIQNAGFVGVILISLIGCGNKPEETWSPIRTTSGYSECPATLVADFDGFGDWVLVHKSKFEVEINNTPEQTAEILAALVEMLDRCDTLLVKHGDTTVCQVKNSRRVIRFPDLKSICEKAKRDAYL